MNFVFPIKFWNTQNLEKKNLKKKPNFEFWFFIGPFGYWNWLQSSRGLLLRDEISRFPSSKFYRRGMITGVDLGWSSSLWSTSWSSLSRLSSYWWSSCWSSIEWSLSTSSQSSSSQFAWWWWWWTRETSFVQTVHWWTEKKRQVWGIGLSQAFSEANSSRQFTSPFFFARFHLVFPMKFLSQIFMKFKRIKIADPQTISVANRGINSSRWFTPPLVGLRISNFLLIHEKL